jgi:hypothetical protein
MDSILYGTAMICVGLSLFFFTLMIGTHSYTKFFTLESHILFFSAAFHVCILHIKII